MSRPLDVVGLAEIAERLSVELNTVQMWSKRGILPPPDGVVSRRPAWRWRTIETWARETGHPRPAPR